MNKTILATAMSFTLFALLAGCGGGSASVDSGLLSSASATPQFTQGKITVTSQPLDLALRGDGFFQLYNGQTSPIYTRRGSFTIDKAGYLLDRSGLRLLMRPVDATDATQPGSAVSVPASATLLGPVATSMVTVSVNLDARAEVTLARNGVTIDFGDLTTYNNATSVAVYDARGQQMGLTLYFQKTAASSWNVYAAANGFTVAGDNAMPLAITRLTFGDSGVAPTQPSALVRFNIPATTHADGVTTQAVIGVQLDLAKSTEFVSRFQPLVIKQNGSAPGYLAALHFEPDGLLMLDYTNGRSVPVGQIELASFPSPACLRAGGDQLWIATQACGQPLKGTPGSGYFNLLQIGAVEGD